MKLRKEQYEQIEDCFLKQQKPAKFSNLNMLNAVLYIMENGCKWRSLPEEYGDWHVIYVQPKKIAKILGTMIKSYTNSAIRLRGFFAVSNGFAVFSLAMIS